jgi:uncharacterized membrane protein
LPYDVNGDGATSPLDALLVINALNAQNDSGQTPSPLGGLDINRDGLLSPIDALKVINFLNGPPPPQWPELISIGNLTVQQQSTPAPLHVELGFDDGVTLMAGAQLPDGKLRLGGFSGGVTPLQMELTGRGELLGTRELPVQAGQLQAVVTAVSPNGRWLGGSQNQANYHAALPETWPIYGLWDAENPGAFLPLDLASLTGIGISSITDISDTGAVLINSGDGRAYRWEAASGFQQLISLPDGATTSTPAAQYAHATVISADGRVVVGSSGRLGEAPQATRWIDGAPEALPGLSGSSDALAVSLDGRVIGGSVDDGIVKSFSLGDDGPFVLQGPTSQAAVWVDGQLRLLKDVQGQYVPGEVRHVVSGIGGDPDQWIALGTMGGQTFIAFADGVARNLNDWLRDRYGFVVERQQRIVASFIDGNSLTIVSYDHEHLPLAPFEVGDGVPGDIDRPPAKRLFVLPLGARA